jgi:hypothetical protein
LQKLIRYVLLRGAKDIPIIQTLLNKEFEKLNSNLNKQIIMATTIVKAYGATASTEDLKPLDIERRAVGTDDVKLISPIVVFVIVTYIPQETNGMDLRIQ